MNFGDVRRDGAWRTGYCAGMLEFDSISVSSYEADTLAQKLTEKSAAGWDIVSIVSAGSSVTAYVSRTAESAPAAPGAAVSAPDATEQAVEDFGGEEVGPLRDADLATTDAADAADTSTEGPGESTWAPGPAADAPSLPETPSSDAPSLPETESTGTTAEAEPAGIDSGTGTPSLADDIAALASQIEDDETPAATSEPVGWATSSDDASSGVGAADPTLPGSGTPAAEPAEPAQAAAEPAQEAQQTTAAAAPAGWYADPSGRFELRYWDGGQWTEHVSRAGQQYTDPPVA
jgi:hypothetical protein